MYMASKYFDAQTIKFRQGSTLESIDGWEEICRDKHIIVLGSYHSKTTLEKVRDISKYLRVLAYSQRDCDRIQSYGVATEIVKSTPLKHMTKMLDESCERNVHKSYDNLLKFNCLVEFEGRMSHDHDEEKKRSPLEEEEAIGNNGWDDVRAVVQAIKSNDGRNLYEKLENSMQETENYDQLVSRGRVELRMVDSILKTNVDRCMTGSLGPSFGEYSGKRIAVAETGNVFVRDTLIALLKEHKDAEIAITIRFILKHEDGNPPSTRSLNGGGAKVAFSIMSRECGVAPLIAGMIYKVCEPTGQGSGGGEDYMGGCQVSMHGAAIVLATNFNT